MCGVIEPGLGENLPPLYVISPHSSKKSAYVVACLCLLHALVEHLNTSDYRLSGGAYANYLYLCVQRDGARLYPPCCNSATSLDGEHILYCKQERTVCGTLWLRDVLIHCFHKLGYGLLSKLSLISFESPQGRSHNYRDLISWEVVL